MKRPLTLWNWLTLGAGATILAAALSRLAHTSGPGCGALLLGRYSLPYLLIVALALAAGAGLLIAGAASSADRLRRGAAGLAAAGFGLALAASLMELTLRALHPLPSADDMLVVNHPVLGYARRPDFEYTVSPAQGREFSHRFRTDSNGFIVRGDSTVPCTDPGCPAPRILLLGDSFVEGTQVSADANMSVLLEDDLRRATGEPYRVINAGMGSYESVVYYLAYLTYRERFDPQIVAVVFYVGNDFTHTARLYAGGRVILDSAGQPVAVRERIDFDRWTEWQVQNGRSIPIAVRESGARRGLMLPAFLRQNVYSRACQALEARRPAEAAALNPSQAARPVCGGSDPALVDMCDDLTTAGESLIRNNAMAIFKESYTLQDEQDMAYTFAALRLLRDAVEADGRQLLIVIMPRKGQVPGQPGPPQIVGLEEGEYLDSTRAQDALLAFCRAEGLWCHDLLPALRAHADRQLFWRYDFHLTEEGHRLVADDIAAALLAGPP